MQLTHVRLLVEDFAGCFRFYRDALGLEATFGDEASGYADFRAGEGSALALFDRREQDETVPVREPGDGALLVFGVDDVDAEALRLAEFVVAAPSDRSDWGIRVAYLRDPAGTLIELNQPVAA
jgi:catechol 2,3-dioxygenase-like lactoylglutathione lyase family enzyme